ncbi:putative pentatricopeptide repeat-containing protein At3g47840 [Ananas comosus]|uniref:Pentatricopeptide repeat-containing protein At3g47840 n=1 Tax=Ananas comosus TaxID=4615 RepID=A0A6P5ECI3_ANACO|nr:putative pentatricopeptide repeat-containing protein At3g47840 [Ananas comosus]
MRALSPSPAHLQTLRFARPISTGPVPTGPPPFPYEANTRLKRLVESDCLNEARHLFDEMPHRDEVSYTTIISGYVRASDPLGALSLFSRMRSRDPALAPDDPFVLSLAFKACASDPSLLPHAAALHAFALKTLAFRSVFVATALVDAYSKVGSAALALQVFDEMPLKNVVSWTALISTLVRAGRCRDALRCFADMRAAGVQCDSHTYAVALKACADAGMLARGREVHARAAVLGLDATPFVANTLAAMYARCGHLDLGLAVLGRMRSRDVVAWTTIIASYAQTGREGDALAAFARMRERSSGVVAPNEYTYAAVLAACAGLGLTGAGEQVHAHAARRGFAGARSVANALVTLYARAGRLAAADAAFREADAKDVVSWSAIISGYAQDGRAEEAFALLAEMRRCDGAAARPNEFTLASLLSACGGAAALEAGRQLHALAIATGLGGDAMVASSLIDMYVKSGSLGDAKAVFYESRRDDVVSWTAMLGGYAEHGRSEEALELFDKMRHIGLKPDRVAFIGVLAACCHAGKVELGLKYFEAMREEYGLEPTKEHYGCVVDLLGRAGRIQEAEKVIEEMPERERDGVVWTALLRACAARGEEEVGKRAAERVIEAEPWGAGPHVAMANIYAGKGRWGEAAEERKRMREKGVKKGAGWSSVAVGGKERGVGVFVAADRTHPRGEEIYGMLGLVDYGARTAGSMPELNSETDEELAANG